MNLSPRLFGVGRTNGCQGMSMADVSNDSEHSRESLGPLTPSLQPPFIFFI